MLYSFFTFDAGDIASTTEHITTLFNDLKPLILVIIGLSIGFSILATILDTLGRGYRVGKRWKKWEE